MFRLVRSSARKFSSSGAAAAKAPPAAKGGKKKVAFKPTKDNVVKVKKGGMTHLPFKDAVGALSFEKLAVEVSKLGVSDLNHDLNQAQSTVVKYSDSTEKVLRTLGSFKTYQYHEMFQHPTTLISHNTSAVDSEFISKLDQPSSQNRVCLLGQKGSGKSTLLSQAKALSLSKFNKDIIVLHIDNPERIIDGTSDYIFNPKTKKYQQPMFTKRWIYKLRNANHDVLKKLPLTRDISFQTKRVDYHLKKDVNTLYDYLLHNHDFGKVAPTNAFNFVVEELVAHSKNFPVLVSVDNINTIVDTPVSKYFHPDFTPIHLSEFEIGDFLLKVAGGELSFAKGGVLLATSGDKSLKHKTLSVSLGQEPHDPYSKVIDLNIASTLLGNNGIKPLVVDNLTKDETKSLLKFFESSGVLFVKDYASKQASKSAEELTEEKAGIRAGKLESASFDAEEHFEKIVQNHYTVSSGNPGYLVKAAALSY